MNTRLHRAIVITLFISMLLACNTPQLVAPETTEPDEPAATDPTNSTAPTDSPTTSTEPTPIPTLDWPVKDLSERPQIWFGPLEPWSWDQYFPGEGPFQYYDLFADDAPWSQASEAVDVMRLYPVWLDNYASNDELAYVFDALRDRQIALSYESGPLQEHGVCNAATIEGFNGAPGARHIAQRVTANGGVLYAMDLEHGFDAATYYDPACRMTPTEIAEDVLITINTVREYFPGIVVGSIETAELNVDDVAAWLTAYREVTGEELSHFHLDINYHIPDWAERAREIEEYVQSRGVDFGIIYFGDAEDTSDEQWLARAEQRMIEYEVIHGGRPDHAVFQSWHTHPQRLMPETEPNTFTYFINRYLRTRTAVSIETQAQPSGGPAISGTVTDESGVPLAGVPIEVRMIPLGGSGVISEYTVTGIVPTGAIQADVGYRINNECDCIGEADLTLYEVNYSENDETQNRVPNGNFSGGIGGWGLWGDGVQQIVASDRAPGNALQITVSPAQTAGANSTSFAVTGEARFTVTFTARIAPKSSGSGYFDIIFLDAQQEVQRFTIPLESGAILAGEAVTDSTGNYQLQINENIDSPTTFEVWYPGDDTYWPAFAEITAGE